MAKPVTLDHLKSQKKPVLKTVRLAIDSAVTEQLDDLESDLAEAQMRHRMFPDDEQAKQEIVDLQLRKKELLVEAQKPENSVAFVFKSIGRRKFDDLKTANPPSEKDKKAAEARGADPSQLGWDLENFPIALIAACSSNPVMTEDEVRALMDDEMFSASEVSELFNAALSVNTRSNVVNLGKG